MVSAFVALFVAALVASPQASPDERQVALTAMLERALPEADAVPPGDRALFEQVLASPAFLRGSSGIFDVHVMVEGASEAKQVLSKALAGLEPLEPVLAAHFSGERALVGGRRFPIVLVDGRAAYDEVIALLDHCEGPGFSGWKPQNEVWSATNRKALVTRTWEVQVLDLAHADARGQGSDFLKHGLGYYSLAHVLNRLLRQGAWGTVPPWLAQGLIDELDIEAYGQAWVGGDWWTSQTPGWSRPGWSGFVPQGSRPPQPVTGPPAALGTETSKAGDGWAHRSNSTSRHWEDLAADRKCEAPASFAFMARHESFLPRDRAYARCVLHLLLTLDAAPGDELLAALDRVTVTPPDGMPAAEPLPLLVARSLGGVPEVDRLEALPLGELLAELDRDDLVQRARKHEAEDVLAVADHRAQSAWLYGQPQYEARARGELFNLFLEAEYYQQLRQWEAIGEALDRAADAALKCSKSYPKAGKARDKAVAAFREALESQG